MRSRSLILITVDCLRADRVGFHGYSRPLTPFLDSIAEQSVVFSNAVVAGAPTYFSFPSILASRYPLGLGREVLGIAPGEPTIASVLKESGYETAAFVAANPYLSARFGYHQGFDVFRDFLDSGRSADLSKPPTETPVAWSGLNRRLGKIAHQTRITGAVYDELYFRYCQWRSGREEKSMDQLRRYPSADVLVNQASDWLRELPDRPFFLWLHLMDPHHPYYPPVAALQSLGVSDGTPSRARFLNSFWNRGDLTPARLRRYRSHVTELYDAGVHWIDLQLSRFVQVLRELGRWTDTIFVLTADHGEEFLEHGNRYHSPSALTEQLIRVPLLVHAPELARPCVLPQPFSHIHLAPTLMEALQVNSPLSFKGRRLWQQASAGALESRPAIVECVDSCNNPISLSNRLRPRLMAVRNARYKLVVRFGRGREELYDLKEDPEEGRPLSHDAQASERKRLLSCAHEHLRQERERRDISLSLRARFREIGQRLDSRSPYAATCDAIESKIGDHG